MVESLNSTAAMSWLDSGSELASQLALNTQLLYHYTPHDEGHLLSSPMNLQAPQLRQQGEVLTSQIQECPLDISPPQPALAQEQRQSQAQLLRKPTLVSHDINNASDHPTSSIECQPYVAPVEPLSEDLGLISQLQRGADSPKPFPLVDWIREIRKDTFKQAPMLQVKWVKSIPKRQQAILDSDETWVPPLAGKPCRPGSVPLDLLQCLTKRADEKVTAPGPINPVVERDDHAKPANTVDLPKPQPCDRDSPSRSPRVDELDDEADNATMEASQWSSSPPQPRAPPDSDPITRPYQPTITKYQVNQGQLDTIEEAEDVSQNCLSTEQAEISRHNSQRKAHEPEEVSHLSTGGGPGLVAEDLNTYMNSGSQSSSERSAQQPPEPQTVRAKPVAKVQVKDTPYSPKENQHPSAAVLPDDAPQSSFVGATYPDQSTQPRKVLLGNKSNDTQSIAHTNEVNVRHAPSTALPSKPSTNKADDTGEEIATDQPALNNGKISGFSVGIVEARSPELGGVISDHEMAHARKRQKLDHKPTLERPSTSRVSFYQHYDNRRMLERRRAFRSMSESWTNAGPEDPEAFLRHNNQQQAKSNSQVSSPPVSAKHSTATGSEGINTSATNFSIHERQLPRTPAPRSGSRRASIYVDMESDRLASTFSTFQHAYPDYRGNRKSFRSALQLLIRLQSQPREPHPSMWDDFIFRMAQDYKQYLKECIENDESAIGYQEYYYTHVRRSQRTSEVVREDVLQNLIESTRLDRVHIQSSRLRHSRSASSFRNDGDIKISDATPMIAEVGRDRQKMQEHAVLGVHHPLQPPVEAQREIQCIDEHEIPETQAIPSVASARKPRQSLPSQPIGTQPAPQITKSAARKRRSLPWDAADETTISALSRLPLQKINNTTSTQSSASSKVEEWLLTSRAAGAASPELEAMDLTTAEQDARQKTPSRKNELPVISLPANAIAAIEVTPSIEPANTVPSKTPKPVRQPETKFTLFVANYAQLQSERAFQSLSMKKRRVPINIYEW